MWAPSLRAFFYSGPLVPLPVRDGVLVALNRPALWHLTAPTARSQDAPQMTRVITNIEHPANHRRNPLQSPKLVGKSAGYRTGEEDLLELLALLGGQLLGPARRGLGSQRTIAVLLPVLNPAMHGSGRCPNTPADLSNPLAFLGQLHSAPTARLQAPCRSDGPHGP